MENTNPELNKDKLQEQSAKDPSANLESQKLQSASANSSLGNEPGTRSLYSTDDESNDMVDLESLGFNTTIQQKKSDLLDPSQLEDTVISSVMASEDAPISDEPVLEKLDSFEDDLNLSLVIEREKERKQKFIKYTFFGLLALTIILGAWFFTDARSLLGYTSIEESSQATTEGALVSAKVDLAFSKYYQAAVRSQNLSFLAVELHEAHIASLNQFTEANTRSQANSQSQELLASIKSDLDLIKQNIREVSQILDTNDLKVQLITRTNNDQYMNTIKPLLGDDIELSEFLSFEQLNNEISNLASNADMTSLVLSTDYQDYESAEMIKFLMDIFQRYKNSNLKELALMSLRRSNFTYVLGEISDITKKFDPEFTVFDEREDYIVKHNSYSFDADNSSISVSTDIQTRTPDTFTMVANFEDSILESDMFSGLNVTNFSKQSNKEGDRYQTSLSLSFEFTKI